MADAAKDRDGGAAALPAWRGLVETARFTPSPHNTQPWKVRPLDAANALLFTVRRRTLPDEDTTGCFILCAMGMFVETLSIAAAHAGARLEAEPIKAAGGDELIPFAHLRLAPDPSARPEFTREAILERRTCRLPPRRGGLPQGALARLEAIAAEGGQSFTHTSDPGLIGDILERNIAAIFEDLNDRRYHDEIVTWFRYGRRHAARTMDGLDSACMNMPAHEMWLAAAAPWLMRAPVIRGAMRAVYRRRIGPAHHIGFMAGRFFEPGAAPVAGRCLMRLWLAMHTLGLGMHPFGNLVTNAGAHRWLTEATGTAGIWLVFRFGPVPAAPPRSHRLSAEEILC